MLLYVNACSKKINNFVGLNVFFFLKKSSPRIKGILSPFKARLEGDRRKL